MSWQLHLRSARWAGIRGQRRGSVFNRRAHQSHSRGLRRNTVVWKVYAGFGRKAPHSRPESNETTIPDNPPRILLLFRHYPITIWRRRSESNRRIQLLQSRALPLGYSAETTRSIIQRSRCARASFLRENTRIRLKPRPDPHSPRPSRLLPQKSGKRSRPTSHPECPWASNLFKRMPRSPTCDGDSKVRPA